ncbi:MAG: hypothetical protein A2X67_05360 [Ignavibacteria bacterium GWA2_55_11]|nr:MAG: hypothetical protein A2X67_05360 [Ignavibacteria bacterium GWA2_55_11]
MHTLPRTLLLILIFSITVHGQARQTPFDPDSSANQLRTLCEDIGPRPMGSPGEQRALQHAVNCFKAWGLDDAFVLPFSIAPSDRSGQPGVNTRSGTAVGVKKGTTGRIIVIGAHIDSAGPEIPGANDDGSGSAVVLELARVIAERSWESTIVFCLFGGEESGLKGSYHFVQNFPLIDSVALMLQVDMANGVDWLLPMYDLKRSSAPEWLVNAAYEEFHRLEYKGLYYPTHFYALNSAIGGASSDHQPFLERNIPAIDFTTDVSDPIHTPQDSWTWFELGGLERSGDLVYRLVERFDRGVPDTRSGAFLTLQLGSSPWLIPTWSIWGIVALSVILGVWSVVQVRRGRTEVFGQPRPRIPGLKVAALTFGAVLCGWLTEDVMSLITGLRSPWYGEPVNYVGIGLLGFIFASIGAGILGRRMNLSRDPYRYFLRSAIWFGALIAVMSLGGPRLVVYPALGLIACSIAVSLRSPLYQVAMVTAGAYPTARLIFPEVYEFIARLFASIPAESGIMNILLLAVLSLYVWLLIMPFALCLTGIVRSPRTSWPVSVSFSNNAVVAGCALILVVTAGYNAVQTTYSEFRPCHVEIVQEFDSNADTVRTVVKSTEYLTGATIRYQERDTVVTGHETIVHLPPRRMSRSTWMTVEGSVPSAIGDTGASIGTFVNVHMAERPYILNVTYTPKHASIVSADAGPLAVGLKDGVARLRWYSFPDTLIAFPVALRLSRADTVTEIVEATFVGQATPVSVASPVPGNVDSRTIVRSRRTIAVGRDIRPPQESE